MDRLLTENARHRQEDHIGQLIVLPMVIFCCVRGIHRAKSAMWTE